MPFLDAILEKAIRRRRATSKIEQGAGDATLSISVSDAGWNGELCDTDGVRWQEQASSVVESAGAVAAEQLTAALARFSAERPYANVARVVVAIDDPDVQLVDHRFAKLTNFEPRGLKEFGSQQSGGQPVVFGTLPFGASSAREIQKRVLGFLPEGKLEACFFGLGKVAPALVAVLPGGANTLSAPAHEAGISASLRVHGYFSTLVIANAQTGIIAVRHFDFGALMLAKAYADEHGISLAESVAALETRSRLPPVPAVKDGAAAEHKTGTFAALAPVLRRLHDEIAATVDYFRFQRLAGRPVHLSLIFTAQTLAGLDGWLAQALDLQVEAVPNAVPIFQDATEPTRLNLLEGSRAGLLKMGNQPYEFSDGRFRPMKEAHSDMSATKPAGNSSFPTLNKFLSRFGADALTIKREKVMAPALAVGAVVLLAMGNFYFLAGPAAQRLEDNVFLYDTAAQSSLAAVKSGTEVAGFAQREKPLLWAENLLVLGQALLPSMKLERLNLVATATRSGGTADLSLTITGSLPTQRAANLKSVAGFIDTLSKDKSFSRRFPLIRFTGAGNSKDENQSGMSFQVAALSGSAPR